MAQVQETIAQLRSTIVALREELQQAQEYGEQQDAVIQLQHNEIAARTPMCNESIMEIWQTNRNVIVVFVSKMSFLFNNKFYSGTYFVGIGRVEQVEIRQANP